MFLNSFLSWCKSYIRFLLGRYIRNRVYFGILLVCATISFPINGKTFSNIYVLLEYICITRGSHVFRSGDAKRQCHSCRTVLTRMPSKRTHLCIGLVCHGPNSNSTRFWRKSGMFLHIVITNNRRSFLCDVLSRFWIFVHIVKINNRRIFLFDRLR